MSSSCIAHAKLSTDISAHLSSTKTRDMRVLAHAHIFRNTYTVLKATHDPLDFLVSGIGKRTVFGTSSASGKNSSVRVRYAVLI